MLRRCLVVNLLKDLADFAKDCVGIFFNSIFFVVKPENIKKNDKNYKRFFSLIKETILSADILRYGGNCLSNKSKSV